MAIKQENLERLGPRLRVVCNGDEEVNNLRAQLSAAVEVKGQMAGKTGALEMLQQAVKRPKDAGPLPKPPSDQPSTDAVQASCFIRLASPETARVKLPGKTFRRDHLVTAQLSPREIEEVLNQGPGSGISYIEMGEPLSLPHPVVSPRRVEEPKRRAAAPSDPYAAPPVLIGIVDVGGFDFAHPDFLVNGDDAFRAHLGSGAARWFACGTSSGAIRLRRGVHSRAHAGAL